MGVNMALRRTAVAVPQLSATLLRAYLHRGSTFLARCLVPAPWLSASRAPLLVFEHHAAVARRFGASQKSVIGLQNLIALPPTHH